MKIHTRTFGLFQCVDHEIQVNPNFVVPKLYTNPELEQIVILLLLGHEIQKNSGMFVGKCQLLSFQSHE